MIPYDKNDPRNIGVKANEIVGPSNGEAIRRIVYQDPESGKTYTFLTAEMTLPPGIVAFIYKGRWDVEKVFDENKNKLGEDKAWARSATAKKQQAHFICMAHNLILMLCAQLDKQEGITDEKSRQRRAQRKKLSQQKASLNKRTMNALVLHLDRELKRDRLKVEILV